MSYQRADFAPLRDTGYGIGFHWTALTAPRDGEPLDFQDAVDAFDVDAFVQQAVDAGAGHVLITTTHAWQKMPCPNPEVDKLVAGRTCKRDLLMELADGLAAAGIKLMLYYHHGIHAHGQDAEWREAVGWQSPDYYDNYCRVVGWLGEHYGPKVIAWWFDAAGDLANRSDPPWDRMAAAAKAGHPGRLICQMPASRTTRCTPSARTIGLGKCAGSTTCPVAAASRRAGCHGTASPPGTATRARPCAATG